MTEESPSPAPAAVFSGPDTAAAARVTVRAMLAGVPDAFVGHAVALVDELVADAARDGATFRGLRLGLVKSPLRLRIDVEREEPAEPAAGGLCADRIAGRLLLEDLASTWWSHTLGDLSVTRAELVLPVR
ncbi:MAG TPA: hypothetical protein VG674_15165 [Amycolatopsis sp.]|nr:hypothetical protein [Amycolatopsis sp.]